MQEDEVIVSDAQGKSRVEQLLDFLGLLKITTVKRLEKRRRFLKQNPDFMSSGSFRRGTASHLYMKENLPVSLDQMSEETQVKYGGPFGRIQMGNEMWSKLPDDEKEEYAMRAQGLRLEDIKSKTSLRVAISYVD